MKINNELIENLDELKIKLAKYTRMLIDVKKVKFECRKDRFKFVTKNNELEKILNEVANDYIEYDEMFVISKPYLNEIINSTEENLKNDYDLYSNTLSKFGIGKLAAFNKQLRKIIWTGKLIHLRNFHKILMENEHIEKCSFRNFNLHFQINKNKNLENNKDSGDCFLIWKSSERLFIYTFELLEKNKFLIKGFFNQTNRGYQILTENFIKEEGDHFSNVSLGITSTQKDLYAEEVKTEAHQIIQSLSYQPKT